MLAVCCALATSYEGTVLKSYVDPVGVLTAVLGGVYLLWRMKSASGGRA